MPLFQREIKAFSALDRHLGKKPEDTLYLDIPRFTPLGLERRISTVVASLVLARDAGLAYTALILFWAFSLSTPAKEPTCESLFRRRHS
jgi:hypothetical protein